MKKLFISLAISIIFILSGCSGKTETNKVEKTEKQDSITLPEKKEVKPITLDTLAYNQKIAALANGDTTGRWPVQGQPYPLDGAILPFKRIVAY